MSFTGITITCLGKADAMVAQVPTVPVFVLK